MYIIRPLEISTGASKPKIFLPIQNFIGKYESEEQIEFLIDTGADISCIPIEIARQHGIPFKLANNPNCVHTNSGWVYAHPNKMKVKIMNKHYTWDCLILDLPNPASKSVPNSAPSSVSDWAERQETGRQPRRVVLGRKGFLSIFEIRVDDTYLVIVRKNSLRTYWRHAFCKVANYRNKSH